MSDSLETNEQYQCDNCGGVFDKGWSDEEAHAESIANGFGPVAKEDMAMVCDECYAKIMAHFGKMS